MFIRVVLLININTNNSYITTLQELSVCVQQDTLYTLHPHSAVNTNPSQDYTRVEVSLIGTPFPCMSTPPLSIYQPPTPHNSNYHTPSPHPRSKSSACKNKLGNLITLKYNLRLPFLCIKIHWTVMLFTYK